ncbi:MAG: class A beta-lactamase-related serine hydrolase [Rickettsiales bacterium]|nr:class A beta-lactamase-related serine hydrolase [Rickettsiales bacterium]
MKNYIKKFLKYFPGWGREIAYYAINLNSGNTAAQNENIRIYPASSYKIFIAAEILKKCKNGELQLDQGIKLKDSYPVWADIYPINSTTIAAGKTFTINILLELMLRNSDNRASNSLVEQIGLDNAGRSFLEYAFGATQKYTDTIELGKKSMYSEKIAVSSKDLAEFMRYVFESGNSIAEKLKHLMLTSSPDGLLKNVIWQKAGFLEAMPKTGPKLLRKFWCVRYKSQAAIVKSDDIYYAIGIMTKSNSLRQSKQIDLSVFQKAIEDKLR